MGLLPSVDFLVLKEASVPSETSLTLTAFIRDGSLDIPLLAVHLPGTLPSLPTLRILNISIAMDPLMSQEM